MNFLKVAQLFQLCCVFGYLLVLDSIVKQRRCLCHKWQFLVSKTCLQCKKNLKRLLSFICLSAIIISFCSWNYKGCGRGGGEVHYEQMCEGTHRSESKMCFNKSRSKTSCVSPGLGQVSNGHLTKMLSKFFSVAEDSLLSTTDLLNVSLWTYQTRNCFPVFEK